MFKAQSAIEYLMTYGWMLIVVAITGAAIFGIAQQQGSESVSGFTGADVQVEDFGVTSENELELVLRNAESDTVTVESVNVSGGESFVGWTGGESIGVGDSETVSLENVSESDSGTESFDIDINYGVGGLTNLQVSGTITAPIELDSETTEEEGNGEETQTTDTFTTYGIPHETSGEDTFTTYGIPHETSGEDTFTTD